MLGTITITERGASPHVLFKNQHKRVMRAAFEDTAVFYHRSFQHRKFTTAGASEHGFKPRAGERGGLSQRQFFSSYTGRKLRTKGHRRKLVWSGTSERLARIQDVRPTAKGARIVNHARGLRRRNPHSPIDMAAEIRSVSPREARASLEFFRRRYAHHANAVKGKKVTRIR